MFCGKEMSLLDLINSIGSLSVEDKARLIEEANKHTVKEKEKEKEQEKEQEKCFSDMLKECKVELRPYQLDAVKHMITNDSLLIVHGTGKGKTLTALATAKVYLNKHPEHHVVVVSPAALVGNFHKENVKYNEKSILDDRYSFYSFRGFASKEYSEEFIANMPNTLLIIDEVHNLRNKKSKTSIATQTIASKAHKIILLTATPFVNYMGDFKVLCDLLYKREVSKSISHKPELNSTRFHTDVKTIVKLLANKVSYENDKDNPDYPETDVYETNIHMDEEYYKKYLISLKKINTFGDNPEAFYHGYRRVVNSIGLESYYSAKLKKIAELYSLKKEKSIIFTNWIEFGTEISEKILTQNGITYKVIDGTVKPKVRLAMVEEFNNEDFKVLIITRAGYEGLDLKGVRKIYILDPVWHPTGYEQIIGRGVRYKSHHHLPLDDRNVTIHKLLLVPPVDSKRIDLEVLGKLFNQNTGDQLLYNIIDNKRKMYSVVEDMIKKISL